MNSRSSLQSIGRLGLFVAAAIIGHTARADLTFTSGPLDLPIPDDTDTGLAHSITVPALISFTSVSITLDLAVPAGGDAWLGDLHAYVQHDSGLAVLLNRVGRTDETTAGYDDSRNVSVTFAADAGNGDIHGYRVKLFGDETTPLTGPLTGVWEPDARATDPAHVLGIDARTANLDGFNALGSAGTWTLFVSDHATGGQYNLEGWGVNLQQAFSPIPEPASVGAIAGLFLCAFATWKHRLALRRAS